MPPQQRTIRLDDPRFRVVLVNNTPYLDEAMLGAGATSTVSRAEMLVPQGYTLVFDPRDRSKTPKPARSAGGDCVKIRRIGAPAPPQVDKVGRERVGSAPAGSSRERVGSTPDSMPSTEDPSTTGDGSSSLPLKKDVLEGGFLMEGGRRRPPSRREKDSSPEDTERRAAALSSFLRDQHIFGSRNHPATSTRRFVVECV